MITSDMVKVPYDLHRLLRVFYSKFEESIDLRTIYNEFINNGCDKDMDIMSEVRSELEGELVVDRVRLEHLEGVMTRMIDYIDSCAIRDMRYIVEYVELMVEIEIWFSGNSY